MRTLRGFAVGFLSLTFLEVVVTSSNAAGAAGTLASLLDSVVTRALDPAVAAIPNPAGYNPAAHAAGTPGDVLKFLAQNASDTTAPSTPAPAPQTAARTPTLTLVQA